MVPGREYFQAIRSPWLFYILAAIAGFVFFVGVWRRIRIWRESRSGIGIPGLARAMAHLFEDGLIGRRLFRAAPSAGVSHLLILWGFLGLFGGTLLISADHYLIGFLTGRTYLFFSLAMEVFGLLLLSGLVWVLVRRFVLRASRLERCWEDLAVPLLLLAAGLTGFLTEGARLAGDGPLWAGWSIFGNLAAGLWPSPQKAQAAHGILWWTHALLSLGLIAWLPFSKLFHALAAPVSLVLQDQPLEPGFGDEEDGETEEEEESGPLFSFREAVHLDACTRCGLCLEVCPAYGSGEPLAPRTVLGELRKNREETPETVWYCTTCRACYQACPVAAAPLAVIKKVRSRIVEEGSGVPPMLGDSLERLYKYANPWLAKKGRKADWTGAGNLTLPLEDPGRKGPAELLYFVGCTTSLETRAQSIAQSLAAVFQTAGLSFRTLGKKEPCCGDLARQLGERGLFADQREKTLRALKKRGLGRVVVSSPHCYDTFVKTYPEALETAPEQTSFRPLHYTQVLAELAEDGRLDFQGRTNLTATYHDPCYLARHNGIIDPPRRVLRAVPGLELREMADHGRDSLCCGGGGGRMWQELEGQASPAQGTMAHRRLAQARATGAEVIVTACPLCLIMLEDGRKTGGFEDSLKVMDLAELTARALGLITD